MASQLDTKVRCDRTGIRRGSRLVALAVRDCGDCKSETRAADSDDAPRLTSTDSTSQEDRASGQGVERDSEALTLEAYESLLMGLAKAPVQEATKSIPSGSCARPAASPATTTTEKCSKRRTRRSLPCPK
jgi:hypothetical protein